MSDFKLGKLRPKIDKRTFRLPMIFKGRRLPVVPDSFNVDQDIGMDIPTPMFANDSWGCCVISSRSHMSLRFEAFEQRLILNITDDDVLGEYWKEQNKCCISRLINPHPDRGLVMLDSLKYWRQGWEIGGNRYNIYAFAGIDCKDYQQIKASIAFLRGAYIGIDLPISAQYQTGPDLVWDIDNTPAGRPGTWGGHAVYVLSYDKDYLTCATWGFRQRMTWQFVDKYFDEAYGVVDDRNKFTENSPVDVEYLDGLLKEITK